MKIEEVSSTPPARKHQKLKALRRGKATSRAPTWEGEQVVGEGRGHGHDHQEHHGHAVHGEHAVVGPGSDHRAVGGGQLEADEQGFGPAHQEEEQGRRAVHDADALVVDGEQPTPPALAALGPGEHAERAVGNGGAGGQREDFLGGGDRPFGDRHRLFRSAVCGVQVAVIDTITINRGWTGRQRHCRCRWGSNWFGRACPGGRRHQPACAQGHC